MMRVAYVDTSAFIKRFVPENHSTAMDDFASNGESRMAISSLTVTEFRSVMKRRLRLGTLSSQFVSRATEQLLKEISAGALRFQAIDASIFNLAGELIERLESPLGTLDSLHLACAKTSGATMMVSADRQLLRASTEAGLEVLDLSSDS